MEEAILLEIIFRPEEFYGERYYDRQPFVTDVEDIIRGYAFEMNDQLMRDEVCVHISTYFRHMRANSDVPLVPYDMEVIDMTSNEDTFDGRLQIGIKVGGDILRLEEFVGRLMVDYYGYN